MRFKELKIGQSFRMNQGLVDPSSWIKVSAQRMRPAQNDWRKAQVFKAYANTKVIANN